MSEVASSESSWSRYLSLRYATQLVEGRDPPDHCSVLSDCGKSDVVLQLASVTTGDTMAVSSRPVLPRPHGSGLSVLWIEPDLSDSKVGWHTP